MEKPGCKCILWKQEEAYMKNCIIKTEHPDLDESKIFNYDETGFPTDQNGGKFISVKVECAFKPLLVQEGNILCSGFM